MARAGEATDAAGHTATATFKVTVKGAAAQLVDMLAEVEGVGSGTSLAEKVEEAQAALAGNAMLEACSILQAFSNQVEAQSGKSVPAAPASTLIADATQIRAVLGF